MELIVRQFSHDRDLEVVRRQRRLAGIDEVATILDGRVKRVEAECFRNADRQNRGGFTPGGNGNRGNPSRTIPAASISRRRQ